MPSFEYFLVAESASIDQLSNRISLFHVLEEFKIPEFPFNIHKLVAVSSWNWEEGDDEVDFQSMVSVSVPGKEEPTIVTTNFQMDCERRRVLNYFFDLDLECPGELKFELLLNGESQAHHVVSVKEIDSAEL